MKIAIMSDSHDHLQNMTAALKLCQEAKVAHILHCGDFVAPFMLQELNRAGIPVDGVFGNNDGDIYTMTKLSLTELHNITLHNVVADLELGGCHIGMTHSPAVGLPLLQAKTFDLVCWGHTHCFAEHHLNGHIGLNPGDIMGKEHPGGFCLFDTITKEYEHLLLI